MDKKPYIGEECCASACREVTVVELLEQKREQLIHQLKSVDEAIQNLKGFNPEMNKALREVMRLGQ